MKQVAVLFSIFIAALCCASTGALAQTTTYNSTGVVYTYTVAPGVGCLSVDMAGARGGNGYPAGAGGWGGRVQCELYVTPGEVLYISCGGEGLSSTGVSSSSFGGISGTSSSGGNGYSNGGGGGGSSSIALSTGDFVIVAAGGGGGNGYYAAGDAGGAGGGSTGGSGTYEGIRDSFEAGGGGTQTTGGAGAVYGGANGTPIGGGHGYSSLGAGGGGGYWGGGGSYFGSAGGGSSYPISSTYYCTAVDTTSGYESGGGYVTISVGACTPVTISATTSTLCAGATTTLTATPAGGDWSSSSAGVATVGSSSGIVMGVGAGTTIITYTPTSGFIRYDTVTVLPNPPSAGTISGSASSLCTSGSLSLSDTTSGGVWSALPTTVATIGSASGIVTAVAAGSAVITYSVTSGCGTGVTTYAVTVDTAPSAGTITDTSVTVCAGASMAVADAATGGSWSTALGNATINTAGLVTGVTAGIDTVVYAVTNACGTAKAHLAISVVNCSLGVSNVAGAGGITLYPNPANDILIIQTSAPAGRTFSVSNMTGTILASGALTDPETALGISYLPAGMYLVNVTGAEGSIVRYFVKL